MTFVGSRSRSVLGGLLVVSSVLAVGCGAADGSASEGSALADPDHRKLDAGSHDGGDSGAVDAGRDAGDAGDAGASFAGTWTVAAADVTAAGFSSLTLAAGGTYTQTGRTDGESETGAWSEPATISIDPDFGAPPAGMHGPYIQLDNDPLGDGEWVYGFSESADGKSLSLTLYAQRNGMGLRWAAVKTFVLTGVPVVTAPSAPTGSWKTKTAADTTAAGFRTVTLASGGGYTQTGRTDDETESGAWSQPATISIDPDFGSPPAGMHGPYVELDNDPTGDGEWVYGWSEAADGSALTLTLYAQRNGMGLRWAGVKTIDLVKD